MTRIRILGAASAAALLCLSASVALAGDSAHSWGAVGSIAYADKDNFFGGFFTDETSIAAGAIIGSTRSRGTAAATLDGSYRASASTGGSSETTGGVAVSGGDTNDGCGCTSTSARASGSLSLSSRSGDAATAD